MEGGRKGRVKEERWEKGRFKMHGCEVVAVMCRWDCEERVGVAEWLMVGSGCEQVSHSRPHTGTSPCHW